MHWPTHGQWWSNFWTQLLQIEQWEARGGRYSKQVSQNFTFTAWPFIFKSFIRGIFRLETFGLTHSIDGVLSNASSDSGGCEFLGIIPGSPPDVKNRKAKSCTNHLQVRLVCFSSTAGLVSLYTKKKKSFNLDLFYYLFFFGFVF